MADSGKEDRLFERLADSARLDTRPAPRAPSRLKARIYSALMQRESRQGRLRAFAETKAEGGRLCVFEELMRIAPVGAKLKSANICRMCHARVLGETLENPPIYWAGCPYVEFKK